MAAGWAARGLAAAFAGIFAGALRTRAALRAIHANSNALARHVKSNPAMTQSPCGRDTPRWRDVVNALTTGTKASDAAATASRSCHLRRWNRKAYTSDSAQAEKNARTSQTWRPGMSAGSRRLTRKKAATPKTTPAMVPAFRPSTRRKENASRASPARAF
ncbi:hypothetical protein D3C71_1540180 [compost metagenome]